MPHSKCARALFAAVLATLPIAAQTADPPAPAQAPAAPTTTPAPAPAAPTWSVGGVNISGVLDGYYGWNNNHPVNTTNTYYSFDDQANMFSLNLAKITLDHDADPVGFKLELGFGDTQRIFHAFDPIPNKWDQYILQAYATYKLAKAGTTFDFGQFYTSAGAEVVETHLNWNYSRSLLFTEGPFYHFGLRVNQPLGKGFNAGFQLVNGWNNVPDNNSGKTIGLVGGYTGKKFGLADNYYFGPEKTGTNDGWRYFNDTVLTLTPTDKVSAYFNFDYGTEKLIGGGSNDWIGLAGAARFQATPKVAFSPRLEWYKDKDGFITGYAQSIKEFTITGEYKWLEGLLTRLEYRRDWSTQDVYYRGSTPNASSSMDTITIGFVAFFGPKR